MTPLAPGTVTLVGGGPGDPGLMTVAGMDAIRQADVVLYDRLAPAAVLGEAPAGAELIDVGKLPRGRHTPQPEINALLVQHALAGSRVVRLKGGDSFVFGRGGEEWQACADHGVPVRVIPGVTSAVSVPELAGIPVTHRSLVQGFTVVSGHVPPGDPRSQVDWAALARANTTLVILMGVTYLPEITAALMAGGLDPATPAAIVQDGCQPTTRTLQATLACVAQCCADEGVTPPAVIVVGAVAGLDLSAGQPD